MSQQFDIYFSGQLIEGFDEGQVRQSLSANFNLKPAQLDHLFSGTPVAVKKNIDENAAAQFRLAFRKAGALVQVHPAGETITAAAPPPEAPAQPSAPAPSEQSASSAPSDNTFELLPPRTGSLADCAETVIPAVIPDISAINLAPEGSILDETPPPPPADIKTDELSLAAQEESKPFSDL